MLRASVKGGLRSAGCSGCLQKRTYAAASASSYNFQPSEAGGVKIASRDIPGSTSTLAVVAKAGSRYEWVPGLSEGLEKFAFRNTHKRFAVRIVRESELLGSELFSYRTREAVVYGAKFMKEDLPYFAELLAEVATLNKYQPHVLREVIEPLMEESHHSYLDSSEAIAVQGAHMLAFHRGLGGPMFSATAKPFHLHAEEVEAYGSVAFSKPNFALVGSGVSQADLSKWTGEFFKDASASAPSGLPSLSASQTKYFGGEERISSSHGNTMVIGFSGSGLPASSFYKPEIDALASVLGGQSSIKWASGSSLLAKAAEENGVKITTTSAKYSDAGLLYVTINGSAKGVAAAAKLVASSVKNLGSVPKEALTKAIAQAKFKAYDLETGEAPLLDVIGLSAISGGVKSPEELLKGITGVSESAITSAAKKLVENKVVVSTVGDLSVLPFAEELGLNV